MRLGHALRLPGRHALDVPRRPLERAAPDLAIYLAGADPYVGDVFGRLSLTKEGLAARDRLVLEYCRGAGIPVAVTMAGGYARHIEDTVDIHFSTVALAKDVSARVPRSQ